MSYSPGPWRWEMDHANEIGTLSDSADQVILGSDVPLTQANARLIAAAPELLEALRAAASVLWMAEQYAEAGGSSGPEMHEFMPVKEHVTKLLARIDGKEAP